MSGPVYNRSLLPEAEQCFTCRLAQLFLNKLNGVEGANLLAYRAAGAAGLVDGDNLPCMNGRTAGLRANLAFLAFFLIYDAFLGG